MAKPWEKYATEEETSTGGSAPWEQTYVEDNENPRVFRQDDDVVTQTHSQEEYDQTGKPLEVFGMETPIRTQKSINTEGEKRTHLVPPPVPEGSYDVPASAPGMAKVASGMLEGIERLGGEGTAQRTIGGGALEAVKSTLTFSEYLSETVGLNDKDVQIIEENFATMPAANNMEKATQEILSTIIGATAGGNITGKLVDKFGVPQKLAETWAEKWPLWKKLDPAHAQKKLELLIRWGLTEVVGTSVGATITTPDDTESISEMMGVLPETVGPLSEDETDRLGHLVDNVGFTVGLSALAKLVGVGGKYVNERFLKGFKKGTNSELTKQWLKEIDSGITDALPTEELANRITILGEVLEKHQTFKNALTGGEIDLDSSTALIAGAREYIERAYGFRKAHMDLAEYNQQVKEDASELVAKVISIKQGLKGHEIVQQSDSKFMEQASKSFGGKADELASPEQGNQAGQRMGQPIVDDLREARVSLDEHNLQKKAAEENLAITQDRSQVIDELEAARREDSLGSTAKERSILNGLTRDQLFDAWTKGKARVDDAFKQVPNNPVDPGELAALIKQAGDEENILEILNINPSQSNLKKVGDDLLDTEGNILESPVEDLADKLMEAGINNTYDLLNRVRPSLQRRINAAMESTNADDKLAVQQLITLRNGIDDLIKKDSDPAIQRAMSTYAEFADTWLQTPGLRKYDATVRNVKETRDGLVKGSLDANRAGMEALAQAEGSLLDDDLSKFVLALQSGGDGEVSTNIGRALVGKALKGLVSTTKPGQQITSEQLQKAIDPYIRSLETVDSDTVVKWRETIDEFKAAESGLGDIELATSKAEIFATEILDKAQRDAARFFVSELTGNAEILKDTGPAFKALFSRPNSANLVGQLLDAASDAGDDLAVAGIKSEFLRYAKDKYFTKTKIGPGHEVAEEFVRDASGSKLTDALEGSGSNDLELIRTVFADDPQTGEAVIELMSIMHNMVNSRSAKPNPFGSNTATDTALQKSVNTMIMLGFGVLNRTATTMRAISGRVTEGHGKKALEAAEIIFAQLATDPSFVRKSLKQLKADATGETFRGTFQRIANRSGVHMARGVMATSKPSENDQTEEAFNLSEEEQERNVEENFEMVDGFFQRKKRD